MERLTFNKWCELNPNIEAEECKKCKGSGTVECSYCDGTGLCICTCFDKHDCGYCKGSGEYECGICDGMGTTVKQIYQKQYDKETKLIELAKKEGRLK